MLKTIIVILALAFPTLALGDEVASVRYQSFNGLSTIETTGGATSSTPFAIASVGKTMTSVALLRLVDRGLLGLDDPVRQHLPADVTDGLGGLKGITLRHLLTMTSGLPDYFTDDFMEAALDHPQTIRTPKAAVTFAFHQRPLFSAGTDFDYSNTNYVLAGMIAEKVTEQSYATLIEAEVFGPAGMSDAVVFGHAPLPQDFPSGHEDGEEVRAYYQNTGFGDGGVLASAQDLENFYRAVFLDRSLLSDTMMSELLRDPLGVGYGMGIEVDDQTVGHSGGDLGFSSDIRFHPESGWLALLLIAKGEANTDWPAKTLDRH
ncbi:MAG: serine hydrolase domain-containing protein [Pseudomonadota bacterium]